MAAMLDTYDMQMVDYTADIDIQMHPSSDPWFQDEAKMEEDGPGVLKADSFTHLKADTHPTMKADEYSQEEDDVTIEVDMEDHQNAEYDMVDDEEIHGSATEILDVEVYDASVLHSPTMAALDSIPPTELSFPDSIEQRKSAAAPILAEGSMSDSGTRHLEAVDAAPTFSSLPLLGTDSEVTVQLEASDSNDSMHHPPDLPLNDRNPAPEHEEQQHLEETEHTIGYHQSVDTQVEDVSHNSVFADPDEPSNNAEISEEVEEPGALADTTSSGDPHEISEGVYIDPPPPVLLSVATEEVYFEHSFFNQYSEWEDASVIHHILLQHLPTLYYEPLSTVFEALREDEFIQGTFQTDAELMLEAMDLTLTIGEDNIFARDITFHDLNVLHDASGISGPLRTRLYASTPRFIVRYQQLQDHVHLLQPPQSPRQATYSGHTQPHDQQSVPHATPAEATEHVDGSEEPHLSVESDELAPELINGLEDHREGTTLETNHETVQVSSQEIQGKEEDVGVLQEEREGEEPGIDGFADEEERVIQETQEIEGSEEGKQEVGQAIDEIKVIPPDDTSQDEEDATARASDGHSTPTSVSQNVDSATRAENGSIIGLDVLEAQEDEQAYVDVDGSEHTLDEASVSQEADEDDVDERYSGSDHVGETGKEDEKDTGGENSREEVDVFEVTQEQGQDELFNIDFETPASAQGHQPIIELDGNLVESGSPSHSGDNEPSLEGADTVNEHDSYINNADDYPEEDHTGQTIPELPTEPISFDDDANWEEDADGEGDIDPAWDEDENEQADSNHSSVTLSSRASKRSFDEFELGGEGLDEHEEQWNQPSSPDPKRSRTE